VVNEISHRTGGHGVDITMITAASQSDTIINQAMEITRKKGKVVVVGDVGLGLKRSPFYEKEIDLLISCSYGPGRYDAQYEEKGVDYPYAFVRWTENRNLEEYLRLVADGRIQLGPILEREYDLSQAPQAYAELSASDRPLSVLLRYPLLGREKQAAKWDTKVVFRSSAASGRVRIALIGPGISPKPSIYLTFRSYPACTTSERL